MNQPRSSSAVSFLQWQAVHPGMDRQMTFLEMLLVLFACSSADLCLSVLTHRLRIVPALLIAPLPAAIVAGVFSLTYFVMISVDRIERSYWTAAVMFGVWAAGLIYCAGAMASKKCIHRRRKGEKTNGANRGAALVN